MAYFEVHFEGGLGDRCYRHGERENFGAPLGFQEVAELEESGGYVNVIFSGGARVRIPQKRIISIVEG